MKPEKRETIRKYSQTGQQIFKNNTCTWERKERKKKANVECEWTKENIERI